MTNSLSREAHAVLLPGLTALEMDETTRQFLALGGVSILLATDRREYLNRRVSPQRMARETADTFRSFLKAAHSIAGPLVVAADQELGGTQRLHQFLHPLVSALPSAAEAFAMDDREIEARSAEVARAARALGVNMFISPIVDVVTGTQPWLLGRALGPDVKQVVRLASAYIRGVQSQGVIATAKHFPGYRELWNDPAVEDARLLGSRADLEEGLEAFRKVLATGVRAVMVGPAVVEAIDPEESASTSKIVVDMLRNEFNFQGLIVSDDLDSKAVMRDDRIEEVAVRSLTAGVDLLLLASGPQVELVAQALMSAVETGRVPRKRLEQAAEKVRAAAQEFGNL
jgi:beta-N-acetylhexosaminidase